MLYSITGTGVKMLANYSIKFNLTRETDKLTLRYIKIGFSTKRKQGILLQVRDKAKMEYVSLELNNNGKLYHLIFFFCQTFAYLQSRRFGMAFWFTMTIPEKQISMSQF